MHSSRTVCTFVCCENTGFSTDFEPGCLLELDHVRGKLRNMRSATYPHPCINPKTKPVCGNVWMSICNSVRICKGGGVTVGVWGQWTFDWPRQWPVNLTGRPDQWPREMTDHVESHCSRSESVSGKQRKKDMYSTSLLFIYPTSVPSLSEGVDTTTTAASENGLDFFWSGGFRNYTQELDHFVWSYSYWNTWYILDTVLLSRLFLSFSFYY